VGALVGLLFGLGCLLIWRRAARPAPAAARGAAADRTARAARAGRHRGRQPRQLVAASAGLGAVAFVLVLGTSQVPVIARAVRGLRRAGPRAARPPPRAQRSVELREVWPEAVDNLASGVRAGLSLPEALTQLGVRGPEQLRSPFRRFGEDYRATGRFGESLDA
jgi:tight adherence protein B